jgi:ABC-type sugar transport system ATPase subunit
MPRYEHKTAIEVIGLRKRFGPAVALDGMSFTVRPGQVTGFVGPNGAGKSTTMRVVLGLDPEGIVWIRGLLRSLAAASASSLSGPPRHSWPADYCSAYAACDRQPTASPATPNR